MPKFPIDQSGVKIIRTVNPDGTYLASFAFDDPLSAESYSLYQRFDSLANVLSNLDDPLKFRVFRIRDKALKRHLRRFDRWCADE